MNDEFRYEPLNAPYRISFVNIDRAGTPDVTARVVYTADIPRGALQFAYVGDWHARRRARYVVRESFDLPLTGMHSQLSDDDTLYAAFHSHVVGNMTEIVAHMTITRDEVAIILNHRRIPVDFCLPAAALRPLYIPSGECFVRYVLKALYPKRYAPKYHYDNFIADLA